MVVLLPFLPSGFWALLARLRARWCGRTPTTATTVDRAAGGAVGEVGEVAGGAAGSYDACSGPPRGEAARGALGWPPLDLLWQLLLAWTAIATVRWNMRDYQLAPTLPVVEAVAVMPLLVLNLPQTFSVFAPRPVLEDFFYTLPARLSGDVWTDLGSEIFERSRPFDALRPLTWEPPPGALPFATNR